jgi:DinB family protein
MLAATATTMRALLAGLPDNVVTRAGDEGWSPRDVLAHLLSIEPLALAGRVASLAEQDQPAIANIDEDQTLAASGYRTKPVGELLDMFAAERAKSLASIRTLDDARLARTGKHQIAGDVSAADIVHHICYHDLLHIGQTCGLLSAPIDESRGAMRVFR